MLNVSSHHSFNSSYWHTKRAAQGMVRKLAIYTIKLQKNVYSGICLLQSARPTASVQKQIFSGVLLNNCSEQFLNFPEKNLRQHPFLVKLQAFWNYSVIPTPIISYQYGNVIYLATIKWRLHSIAPCLKRLLLVTRLVNFKWTASFLESLVLIP